MPVLLAMFAITHVSRRMPDLGVGDKAPPLKVAAFVKGKPVILNKGVHVVEFWATWCGPCRISIPHLTEMAKKYRGRADFTGVSVSESGPDQLGQVKKFVVKMGSQMSYNVAFDGPTKAMDTSYMKAAHQDGIPTAFLVKDGIILWIGHPMGALDQTLEKVLAGRFGVAVAKAEAAHQAATIKADEKRTDAQNAALAPAEAALDRRDYEVGLRELDKLDVSEDKEFARRVLMKRFYTLARMGDPRLRAVGKQVIAGQLDDDLFLTVMARDLLDPASKFGATSYPTALDFSERAMAIAPKKPVVMDCYAVALAKSGRVQEAIDAEEKAIKFAKADPKFGPDAIKIYQDRLDGFRKMLTGKGEGSA